ncbi:hypothetical protein BLA60_31870 [Actinophytocola xinjiangensis]|uniref:Peptidase S8/S53 domain-containing protein n=1 Tax=Actinophytocola xinjiangensis TaxID=485602 RepID=A0A7Z1AW71_9PSEU|nr:S8 family serine peptidase [Actinophytocola xinjiangensis]OLF06561.1 hypothetical protein BLA60_31870 [Actinophytocola xinjiangensis]
MTHPRARAVLAALVAVASAVVLPAGSAVAEPAGKPLARPPSTVTLVTGDVVTLGGPAGVRFTPGAGREHIGFRSHTDVDGDVHVIPDDALTGVSAGRLDPRLFDVSELVRTGYGDDARADLPLIVDHRGALSRTAGASAVRELPTMGATALRAAKDQRFWSAAHAERIWLDGPVRASLEHSVPRIGAPAAWEAGLTGAGATVAVLDTGIDVTHPDLADAVTGARDFTGSQTGTDDHLGHGTHVASIVTGAGQRHRGVAPDAALLNGKVLDDTGEGLESWVIAGIEWAAGSGADVINLSLGSGPTDGTDPMSAAVDRISAETGTLVVAAAGNDGPGAETVSSPGTAGAALTVGAVDRDDQLAGFSSRGPRPRDGAVKPEITAPGVGIVAARAANGMIGDPVEDGYVALDGTSMAAPHVAGAAAILAGAHPDWTGDRLKSTLVSTARPSDGPSVFEQGAGRVDVAAAVGSTVSVSAANLFLGVAAWPHEDDEPVAKTVSYTNSGTEPVTLALAADVRGPEGEPAPAGLVTLSADEITVPAGGTAEVTVTADTSVEADNGVYAGTVTATGDGAALRTVISVNREAEVFDVDLEFLNHEGTPTDGYYVRLVDLNNPKEFTPYDPSGTIALRLPRGEYFVEVTVQNNYGDWETRRTDFVEPSIVVDGPAEYTFDARDGITPTFVVDRPNAAPTSSFLDYTVETAWGRTGFHGIVSKYTFYGLTPSATALPGGFTASIDSYLAEPEDSGQWAGFHESPYQYSLRETLDGAIPAELEFRVTDDELATVRSTHASATPGRVGVRDSVVTMSLPFTMTEYYTPDVDWFPMFYEVDPAELFVLNGMSGLTVEPVSYSRGTTTEQRWNAGVFAPGFPVPRTWDQAFRLPYLSRLGDTLMVGIPLRADQNLGRENAQHNQPGTTQLLREGEVIAENPDAAGELITDLPPEPADYTLRVTSTQPGRLSTEISAEWTFTSGHSDDEVEGIPVPALAVRFAPDLDEHNSAPAGRFRLPVHVQRNGSPDPARVAAPRIEVSYDDGATWRAAKVARTGSGWCAEVTHPRGAEFVSLRSSVDDGRGNTARQTILHAYALR